MEGIIARHNDSKRKDTASKFPVLTQHPLWEFLWFLVLLVSFTVNCLEGNFTSNFKYSTLSSSRSCSICFENWTNDISISKQKDEWLDKEKKLAVSNYLSSGKYGKAKTGDISHEWSIVVYVVCLNKSINSVGCISILNRA